MKFPLFCSCMLHMKFYPYKIQALTAVFLDTDVGTPTKTSQPLAICTFYTLMFEITRKLEFQYFLSQKFGVTCLLGFWSIVWTKVIY